ncbi:MAG: PIN domain-containing protein [Nitrospirae bacterium]|nr:PIN domain-containing protein [Candidatus Manganitrophaceae bacterium]
MRVILDTNVLVSGIFFSGPPYQILSAWRDGKIAFVISPEILEEYERVGEALLKLSVETALGAEIEAHLGYEPHAVSGRNSGNNRNGHSKKRLKGDFGEIEISTPRDRNSSFEPQLIKKGQTRFTQFD